MPDVRLIDANALMKRIEEVYCKDCNSHNGVMCRACAHMDDMDFIEDAPTIDAQPVKHGHWHSIMMSEATGWDLSLTGGRDSVCELICSLCKRPAIVDENGEDFLPSFCPNCGAKMDGDADDGQGKSD